MNTFSNAEHAEYAEVRRRRLLFRVFRVFRGKYFQFFLPRNARNERNKIVDKQCVQTTEKADFNLLSAVLGVLCGSALVFLNAEAQRTRSFAE